MATVNPSALVSLLSQYLRQPVVTTLDAQGDLITTFDPPLSAAEQTIYDRLVRMAKAAITGITPAEWEALESDIAGLVTYQGIASPTAAQTAQAVKAQSRILRALLRN